VASLKGSHTQTGMSYALAIQALVLVPILVWLQAFAHFVYIVAICVILLPSMTVHY
jgi:hypothetical protein